MESWGGVVPPPYIEFKVEEDFVGGKDALLEVLVPLVPLVSLLEFVLLSVFLELVLESLRKSLRNEGAIADLRMSEWPIDALRAKKKRLRRITYQKTSV